MRRRLLDRSHFLRPSVSAAHGKGSDRRYNFHVHFDGRTKGRTKGTAYFNSPLNPSNKRDVPVPHPNSCRPDLRHRGKSHTITRPSAQPITRACGAWLTGDGSHQEEHRG